MEYNKSKANHQLILKWEAPILISQFVYDNEVKRGVYIWGFTITDKFIPYYVGIADNIITRIYQHITCILSGQYTIYHSDLLANFKEFKNKDAKADNPIGKLYEPNWPTEYNNFLKNRNLLQPHINFMVDTFTFLYAVVDSNMTGQDLKEIEKICINQIGKENLANTRMGDSQRFSISHEGYSHVFKSMNQKNS